MLNKNFLQFIHLSSVTPLVSRSWKKVFSETRVQKRFFKCNRHLFTVLRTTHYCKLWARLQRGKFWQCYQLQILRLYCYYLKKILINALSASCRVRLPQASTLGESSLLLHIKPQQRKSKDSLSINMSAKVWFWSGRFFCMTEDYHRVATDTG